jgi:hypothetical protein
MENACMDDHNDDETASAEDVCTYYAALTSCSNSFLSSFLSLSLSLPPSPYKIRPHPVTLKRRDRLVRLCP